MLTYSADLEAKHKEAGKLFQDIYDNSFIDRGKHLVTYNKLRTYG